MTSHGKDKVLFGTNFPQLEWKRCIESVQKDLQLSDDVYERFMWKNACQVFNIPERDRSITQHSSDHQQARL